MVLKPKTYGFGKCLYGHSVSCLGTGSFWRWHWQFLALALYKRSRSSRSSRSARLLEMLDNLGILVDIEILVYIGALVYLGTLAYIAKKKGSAFRQIPLWLCVQKNYFWMNFLPFWITTPL